MASISNDVFLKIVREIALTNDDIAGCLEMDIDIVKAMRRGTFYPEVRDRGWIIQRLSLLEQTLLQEAIKKQDKRGVG